MHIVILTIKHQIQSSDQVRTTVNMGNTGAQTVVANCTVYYKNASSVRIAEYSFNATIPAGQTRNQAFTVTPIDISQFTGTDISIFEY